MPPTPHLLRPPSVKVDGPEIGIGRRKRLGVGWLDTDCEHGGLSRAAAPSTGSERDFWLDLAEIQKRLAERQTPGHLRGLETTVAGFPFELGGTGPIHRTSRGWHESDLRGLGDLGGLAIMPGTARRDSKSTKVLG